jgi:nucleotide-binding universal stress UspA family protein
MRAVQAAVGILGQEQTYLVVSVGPRPSGAVIAPVAGRSVPRQSATARSAGIEHGAGFENAEDEAAIESVQATLDRLPIPARGRVVAGDVREAICRAASEERADVVVLTSQPGGPFRRLFRGSVSNYVLRHAPCAVLVMPDGAVPTSDAALPVGARARQPGR